MRQRIKESKQESSAAGPLANAPIRRLYEHVLGSTPRKTASPERLAEKIKSYSLKHGLEARRLIDLRREFERVHGFRAKGYLANNPEKLAEKIKEISTKAGASGICKKSVSESGNEVAQPDTTASSSSSSLESPQPSRDESEADEREKRCSRCNALKREFDFAKCSTFHDGHQAWCNICVTVFHFTEKLTHH